MAITLTTSQAAAAAGAAAEPVALVSFVTTSLEQYHVAAQPCSWSGLNFAARLVDIQGVQGGGALVPYALPAVKTLTIDLANDDGVLSRQRPQWLRGQPLTYREAFLDVPSYAVRTFAFTMVNQELPSETVFRINAEDVLAPVRRKLVPATDCLITDSLYPNLNRGVFQAGADGRNRPTPFLFGRARSPIYYVDQASDGSHVYVAAIGSAYMTGSGSVADWWDGGFSEIGGVTSATNDGHSTFPWSVRYAVRNSTREDGSPISIPVTEVVVHPEIGPGDPIVRRFADLTWDHGSSAWTTPDEVLVQMFRDCFAGVHMTPTVLNSDSLLTAHSFYTANSIYFDGALIEQRPFEDWLAQWQHDAQTRLILRDQIYLVPCGSRAAVFSLADGNLLNGRLTYTDVPLSQEYSRRLLFYKERSRDADYGPGAGGQGDDRGGSFVRFDAGSGTEIAMASPFIGRRTIASRVNQYWAAQQAAAQRIYTAPVTVKLIAVEEGDLGTLTNSHVGASGQLVDVQAIGRRGGLYDLVLTETDIAVFSAGAPAPDPDFGLLYQRVPYRGGSQIVTPLTVVMVTASHQMAHTPRLMRPFGVFADFLVTSLVIGPTTNDSQFVVAHSARQGSPDLAQYLGGWSLYA